MKIFFLLGWPEISGGTYVIFEHAVGLQKLGHEVSIVTQEHVDSKRYQWHPSAADLNWLVLDQIEEKCDIAIATWWESPFLLHNINAVHYVYFVQSIESRFWQKADPTHHDKRTNDFGRQLCESSYSFAIPVITEASWIREYLHREYNHNPFLVLNGIRKDLYTKEGANVADRVKTGIRVLLEGPVDVPYKNIPKTVALCQEAGVTEIWLLTSSDISSYPGVDRVFSKIPIHKVPEIYRSCDVLVKLSYIEGMFGPPLEMFHCGGTAIVYDVTGHDEYIENGFNSYVVPKDQDELVVSYLQKLQSDRDELERLKCGAFETAGKWPGWNKSVKKFEDSLISISAQKEVSQAYMKKWSKKLFLEHQLRIQASETDRFVEREKADGSKDVGAHNFAQLYYWDETEGFNSHDMLWQHYQSGDVVTLKFFVPVKAGSVWLRLDPSVRIGVVVIRSLSVRFINCDATIYNFSSPDQLSTLCIGGTAKRLEVPGHFALHSYGDDPQLLLPELKDISVEQELEIVVVMQEVGISEFIEKMDALDREKTVNNSLSSRICFWRKS